MAYPCTGPRATTFSSNKSSVPWGRSDFGFNPYTSGFCIYNHRRVEGQGVSVFLQDIPPSQLSSAPRPLGLHKARPGAAWDIDGPSSLKFPIHEMRFLGEQSASGVAIVSR